MLVGDGLFNDFFNAEGSISGRIEVSGAVVEGSSSASPVFNIADLSDGRVTILFLSPYPTLTMCPKEGTTLILMLLTRITVTRLQRWYSGMTFFINLLCS